MNLAVGAFPAFCGERKGREMPKKVKVPAVLVRAEFVQLERVCSTGLHSAVPDSSAFGPVA